MRPIWNAASRNRAEAWLRYARLDAETSRRYENLPASVVTLGDSALLNSSRDELIRGIHSVLGKTLRIDRELSQDSAIVLGTLAAIQKVIPELRSPTNVGTDGFWLTNIRVHGRDRFVIAGANDRGVLYAVFAFLSKIARGGSLKDLSESQQPYATIRWVDQWDNLDGSIERGYAGRSIFFENGGVRADLSRVAATRAFLLPSASMVHHQQRERDPHLLDDDHLPQLVRVANAFRPWGIQLSISVISAVRKIIGGLDTFDPLDPRVADWWRKNRARFMRLFLTLAVLPSKPTLKDVSPFRLWPHARGCRQRHRARPQTAQRLVFYRAFVYNHHLDWREPKTIAPRLLTITSVPSTENSKTTSSFKSNMAHRFSGARTCFPSLQRPRDNKRSDRVASHAGIHRPATPSLLPRSHVERSSGF